MARHTASSWSGPKRGGPRAREGAGKAVFGNHFIKRVLDVVIPYTKSLRRASSEAGAVRPPPSSEPVGAPP